MKQLLFVMFLILFNVSMNTMYAQKKEYQLSGGVIDTATGESTNGIRIKLDKYDPETNTWNFISETITGSSERFLERKNGIDNKGIYKMTFYTYDHFKKQGIESIFPFVEVNINITTDEDYSIPLTITPFSYSTYRGNGYTKKKEFYFYN